MFLSYSFCCDKLSSMWKLGFSGYLFALTPRSRLAGSGRGIVHHSALQNAAPRDSSYSTCEVPQPSHTQQHRSLLYTLAHPTPFPWHNKCPHSLWSFLCRMWKVLDTNRTEASKFPSSFCLYHLQCGHRFFLQASILNWKRKTPSWLRKSKHD